MVAEMRAYTVGSVANLVWCFRARIRNLALRIGRGKTYTRSSSETRRSYLTWLTICALRALITDRLST
jgi:hypothetical protein